jgi:hypothetical protein
MNFTKPEIDDNLLDNSAKYAEFFRGTDRDYWSWFSEDGLIPSPTLDGDDVWLSHTPGQEN